jgi:NAD(P)-dependent dehydrogenase (short-subunit alcohol dehydrogenase family)
MFAAEGAKVTLLGRRREPLEAVASEFGGLVIACDVTDRNAMEDAFEDARAAHGPLDFAILNAGIGDSAPFLRTKREAWDRIIATNLTALFDGTQLALPDLLQGEDKRLVIVASVAGLRGAAYAAPYVASKHGAVGLTRKTNLTVNAIYPAFVDTPMVDESADRIHRTTGRSEEEARGVLAAMNANGRLVTADEVAASILHLCHPSSRSITGACLTIDGGTTA